MFINEFKTKKRAASLLNLTEREINKLIKVAETGELLILFIKTLAFHLVIKSLILSNTK